MNFHRLLFSLTDKFNWRYDKPMPDGRIVGGEDAEIEDIPWQISFQTTGGFHFCGGSIMDATHVITAAHCCDGEGPFTSNVRIGTFGSYRFRRGFFNATLPVERCRSELAATVTTGVELLSLSPMFSCTRISGEFSLSVYLVYGLMGFHSQVIFDRAEIICQVSVLARFDGIKFPSGQLKC